MTFRALTAAALAAPCVLFACSSHPSGPLFQPNAECKGDAVTPYQGSHAQIISALSIGTSLEGFDLDGDGKPDNKLAAVGSLAKSAIDDSFAKYQVLIPMEFFDLPTVGSDGCVKFAIYLGVDPYDVDGDGDSTSATQAGGDCNDQVAAIHPGAAEIAGNRIDDDCNGKADEAGATASDDVVDHDGDGVSLHDGDCDDTSAAVHPGAVEICGDGLDNDCDGVADRTQDADGLATACNPYDDTPDPVRLDARSFAAGGAPQIVYVDGQIEQTAAGLELDAGPSLFDVTLPVKDDFDLELKLTGATIRAGLEPTGDTFRVTKGQLGGVIDARTADTIRGLEFMQVGLTKEDSLLDAAFANILGTFLALPKSHAKGHTECLTPDIDVDRDGLETFCDTTPDDAKKTIDLCIDGDGTEVRDEVDAAGTVTKHCTEATDAKGNPRFVDGISVELDFETRPTVIVK